MRNNERGLSIVEIVIVVLVIAIVLAFALPAVSASIRAYNLRSAASHVAERIAAVRALAMSKNRSVTFSFNNESRRYGFDFTGPSGDGVPDTTDPDDPTVTYQAYTLPADITATFPGNQPITITFTSRGELPIGAAEQAIALSSYGRSATVRVNLRGKVTVE